MTKVINLSGGPGSGKSTTAAGLFFLMKSLDMKVELVREYAKELTYSGELEVRAHQGQVLWEQKRRQDILKGQVDYIITDSPLWVGAVYGRDKWQAPWFLEHIVESFREFDNFNVVIDRAKAFQSYGRTETEDEARNVDRMMLGLMDSARIPIHLRVPGTPEAPELILNELRKAR